MEFVVNGYLRTFLGAPFTLEADVTYDYTIRTGSYPQIIHSSNLTNGVGTITSTEFIDTSGRCYAGWIPAISLSSPSSS